MRQRSRPQRPPSREPALPAPRRWPAAAAAAALLCATLLVYAPSLPGGFVWDDAAHITAPELRSAHGLWRIWSEVGATQQYYPLLHTAFWVEHRLWGDHVLGYHLVNVILHALSALLVVWTMRRLSLPGAWLAGFVYALHPVCVESVAWISEQKSTLSGVFYLAAAAVYLSFDRTRRVSRYALASALFVLALLSKTVTATLPAALLLVLWWKRGHLRWRQDILPLLPWFALGVPAGLFTAWVERVHIGAQGADFALSPLQRFLLAGRAPWFYASKLVWPANLMFCYPRWELNPSQAWQYLYPVGLVAVAAVLFVLARKRRGPLAGFLFFVGTLFPALGFFNVFPFRYSFVADHFQYLAMLGLLVPACAAVAAAARRIGITGQAVSALLPLTLGVLSWQYCGAFRDVETLYRETIRRNPQAFFVRLNLGSELFKAGRIQEAAAEFEAAARLQPGSAEAYENLGNALAALPGRASEAVDALRRAALRKPDSAQIRNNLGLALLSLPGSHEEAIAEFREAVRIQPDFAAAHNNLGLALASEPGRLNEAVAAYREAIRLDPGYAAAYNNLGNAYARLPGRQADAVEAYRTALRLDPRLALAHFNLANVLSEMPDRREEAVSEYRAAVQLDPRMVEAYVNLGLTLAQMPGRLQEAIAAVQQALRIQPELEPARQILARLEAARRAAQQ